jgi:hypothetical protein
MNYYAQGRICILLQLQHHENVLQEGRFRIHIMFFRRRVTYLHTVGTGVRRYRYWIRRYRNASNNRLEISPPLLWPRGLMLKTAIAVNRICSTYQICWETWFGYVLKFSVEFVQQFRQHMMSTIYRCCTFEPSKGAKQICLTPKTQSVRFFRSFEACVTHMRRAHRIKVYAGLVPMKTLVKTKRAPPGKYSYFWNLLF